MQIIARHTKLALGGSSDNRNNNPSAFMVRHKTRWLLVDLDFGQPRDVLDRDQRNTITGKDQKPRGFPTKRELLYTIQQSMEASFGLALSSVINDVHVRCCDETTRLVLLRVPREYAMKIRASITLLTHCLLEDEERNKVGSTRMVASVLSLHGSARTAKVATIRRMQEMYRRSIQKRQTKLSIGEDDARAQMKKSSDDCEDLRERIQVIQGID